MSGKPARPASIIIAVLALCAPVLFAPWQAGKSAHAAHHQSSVLDVEHNAHIVERPPLSKQVRSEPDRRVRDLMTMNLRVRPNSTAAGGNVEEIVLVHYDGDGPAPTTALRFYRSADDVISSSDTELMAYEVSFQPLAVRKG